MKDATRTVGNWLPHWRATTLAVSDRKESTRVLYANLCRKHLEPAPFGAIPLDRLRPTNIEALVLVMRAKSLSDSTIRQTYTVLRAGLDGAVAMACWPAILRPWWRVQVCHAPRPDTWAPAT